MGERRRHLGAKQKLVCKEYQIACFCHCQVVCLGEKLYMLATKITIVELATAHNENISPRETTVCKHALHQTESPA